MEKGGTPVNWEAFYAPFNLTIFPVSSLGIDAQSLIDFADRVGESVIGAGFECELEGIMISLRVLHPDVPRTRDTTSWSSKERRYKAVRTFDAELWQSAKFREKKTFIADAVMGVIDSIPETRLSLVKREALKELVHEAIRALKYNREKMSPEHWF
jgi:hypothetical protein